MLIIPLNLFCVSITKKVIWEKSLDLDMEYIERTFGFVRGGCFLQDTFLKLKFYYHQLNFSRNGWNQTEAAALSLSLYKYWFQLFECQCADSKYKLLLSLTKMDRGKHG